MKPSRDLIQQIAQDEAMKSRCTLDELLHMGPRKDAKSARVRAWARIIAETRCTGTELAAAWGCSRAAIFRAFPTGRTWTLPEKPAPAPKPLYDPMTTQRLVWAHGPDRAADIIAGTDQATQTDITAWQRVGALKGAA